MSGTAPTRKPRDPRAEIQAARREALAEKEAYTADQVRRMLIIGLMACLAGAIFYFGTQPAPDASVPVTYPMADPPAEEIEQPTSTGGASRVLVPVETELLWPAMPRTLREDAEIENEQDGPDDNE